MSATVRTERALLSVLAQGGLTGVRATGIATVKATGGDVVLPRASYAVPIVTSAAGLAQRLPQQLVKVKAATTVKAAGTAVPVLAMVGGAAGNLPAGTKLRWDPPVPGVEIESVLDGGGMTGGSNVGALVRRLVSLEGLGQPGAAAPFWRAQAGDFPAVVVSWESGAFDGRKGNAKQGRTAKYRLWVVVSRLDGDHERRDHGKDLLDELAALLCDRGEADGEPFSVPPVELGAMGRLALEPSSYIYWLDVEVSTAVRRRELKTYADWTATRETLQVPAEDGVTVVDQSHDMDPDTP